MKSFLIKQPLRPLQGKVVLPGDKSIAHRSLILSAIATGKTTIYNLSLNDDNLSTLKVLKQLGMDIGEVCKNRVTVSGRGLFGLRQPFKSIFINESGTTLRLLLGVLAGQNFKTIVTAGRSLSRRPMHRVTEPLRMMGARIIARHQVKGEEYPPLIISGGKLKGITYRMPLASAQVKSAILLAGLYAQGKTTIIEKIKTRDHTERMLKLFKAKIKTKGNNIILEQADKLISPGKIYIPGDISSAAFFIVSAAILPKSKLFLKNVGLNPSRIGIVRVLMRMGADIKVTSRQPSVISYEPMGDLIVRSSFLKGTVVNKKEIPTLIDELPVLMVAASLAQGKTILKGTGELRVKETDRIRSMCENLRKMGAKIKIAKGAHSEDIIIEGVKQLRGAKVKSFGDHRTAMSMVVAGFVAQGQTLIDDVSCISKSFPDFLKILKILAG